MFVKRHDASSHESLKIMETVVRIVNVDFLAILWFGLWALLWIIYFTLDAYTLGIGMLYPFIQKHEHEGRQLQEAVGPFWNGNEVWLITAGGATFAAFPLVYAEMFSMLYVPLFLILFGLFYRAIGLEFMDKRPYFFWRKLWMWAFFGGSVIVTFLLGIAFANMFYGFPFTAMENHVNLMQLLHSYGLLGGLTFVSLALLSGLLWTNVKVSGALQTRTRNVAIYFWLVALSLFSLWMVGTVNQTTLFNNYNRFPLLYGVPVLAFISLLLVSWFIIKNRGMLAFLSVSLTIVLTFATGFIGMFPRMLISRLDPSASITLYEAHASMLTLTIMLIVAGVFVPIVVAYQLWAYRLFSQKIDPDEAKGYS